MDDKNFDNIFGDKLSRGKDFTFTDDKWDKMEKHLDNHLAQKRQKRLLTWLIVPFLTMLGALGLVSWSLHDAKNDIHELKQQITVLSEKQLSPTPSVPRTLGVKNDTVFQKVVVHHYDTVFQTIIRREMPSNDVYQQIVFDLKNKKESDTSNIAPQNTAALQTSFQNSQSPPLSINDKKNDKEDILNSKNIDSTKTPTSNSTKNAALTTLLKGSSDITSDTVLVEKLTEAFEKALENQERKRTHIIKPMKIEGYELGVSAGLPTFDGTHILRQEGFSVGVRGGIWLGEHLKVVGEAQYLTLDYDVEKILYRFDIPTISPPMPNDSLQKVSVEQPYWHYSLGLQYVFGNRRLKPYFGMSLVGQSKQEEQFQYHFKNSITKEFVLVETKRNEDSYQLPIMRLNMGAEYPIWGKLKAQLEGSYDISVGSIPQFKPLWQLKTAILYRF